MTILIGLNTCSHDAQGRKREHNPKYASVLFGAEDFYPPRGANGRSLDQYVPTTSRMTVGKKPAADGKDEPSEAVQHEQPPQVKGPNEFVSP